MPNYAGSTARRTLRRASGNVVIAAKDCVDPVTLSSR